jgi:hypothetical protein
MNEKSGLPIKVGIDLGAKLNLELKAEVPTTSVGRFVDTITDLLKPFAETRLLRADVIRMHREDVAFEIAKRAAKRIELGKNSRPIPLKILVLLLEHGSQEEPSDDLMIEMWANLLANSTKDNSVSPRYVGIVSELNSRQAQLLLQVAYRPAPLPLSFHSPLSDLEQRVEEMLQKSEAWNTRDFCDEFRGAFDKKGVYVWGMLVFPIHGSGDQISRYDPVDEGHPPYERLADLHVLRSLGLVDRVEFQRMIQCGTVESVAAEYFRMTHLGYDVLKSTESRSPR